MGDQTQKLESDITRATTVGQAIASRTVGIPVSVEFVAQGRWYGSEVPLHGC